MKFFAMWIDILSRNFAETKKSPLKLQNFLHTAEEEDPDCKTALCVPEIP